MPEHFTLGEARRSLSEGVLPGPVLQRLFDVGVSESDAESLLCEFHPPRLAAFMLSISPYRASAPSIPPRNAALEPLVVVLRSAFPGGAPTVELPALIWSLYEVPMSQRNVAHLLHLAFGAPYTERLHDTYDVLAKPAPDNVEEMRERLRLNGWLRGER